MFHVKHTDFDVIVIGAGHAGAEAAHAVARMGLHAALVTFSRNDIGMMSCNPAIGGVGKGHLVREIDALGGLMGRVGDKAAIQYRLLNRSKGPAVRGPRIQADREIYQREMRIELERTPNLTIIEGEVIDFIRRERFEVHGVQLSDNREFTGRATILTSGTFLDGVMHIGEETRCGGRGDSKSSRGLAAVLKKMPLKYGRLKTGTPPRILLSSIDFDRLDEQRGDTNPTFLSAMTDEILIDQRSCYITHTNKTTHNIVAKNLSRSAVYGGRIAGSGPRYCPSIEDKIARFPDKGSHQIFLEPEGLKSKHVYPNGISTSLPQDIQAKLLNSIPGLENAKIEKYGYAIEYDYTDPRGLRHDLRVRDISNLYFAGQINGTTGYEEAAAQGLTAGLNAGLACRGQSAIHFDRSNSYIGVMIDDLVSKGVTEPYRIFTSRAEHRLQLRIDNAEDRLLELGFSIGLVSNDQHDRYLKKVNRKHFINVMLSTHDTSGNALAKKTVRLPSASALARLAQEDICISQIDLTKFNMTQGDLVAVEEIVYGEQYRPYIARQMKEAEMVASSRRIAIPDELNYERVSGLSIEDKLKLITMRPASVEEAARLEGVSSSAVLALVHHLRKVQRSAVV